MSSNKTILVTGGAGYIGSHTCVELLKADYQVIVVDNLYNSKTESIKRIKKITGKDLLFFELDVRDKTALRKVFEKHSIDAVIHFAGLKAVGESCEKPILYYQNNVYASMVLAEVMMESGVGKMVFSSSATVYGEPPTVQYSEKLPVKAVNPYGRTKAMVEDIFFDLANSDRLRTPPVTWKTALLRYFNPIGAHESGLIGEDPNGIPNNLMPYVSQVAIGKLKCLSVFGNDYPTRDGTGVRDYIHVVDLAKGHLKALASLDGEIFKEGGCKVYNLGAGRGYSVLELINAFEKVTGKKVNYEIAPRRAGDLAEYFADPKLALDELNWKVEKTLDDMVADTWRWQVNNPQGFN